MSTKEPKERGHVHEHNVSHTNKKKAFFYFFLFHPNATIFLLKILIRGLAESDFEPKEEKKEGRVSGLFFCLQERQEPLFLLVLDAFNRQFGSDHA